MPDSYRVVFRHYSDGWEAYAVDHGAFGSGDSIIDARADFKEALSLLLEIPTESIQLIEYIEECVYPESESTPAIWVRTLQDLNNPEQMLKRRGCREKIREHLEHTPQYLRTFENGVSAFGDIIATVCYPDDLLEDLLAQVGDADRLFVCVPVEDAFLWNCIFTSAAENLPEEKVNIESLDLAPSPTVGQFMAATGVTQLASAPKKILVPA